MTALLAVLLYAAQWAVFLGAFAFAAIGVVRMERGAAVRREGP